MIKKKILLLGFNDYQINDLKHTFGEKYFLNDFSKSQKISSVVAITRNSFEENINKIISNSVDWIHLPGAGIEKYKYLKKFEKITFTNGKIIQGTQVSDHAMALLLSLTRKINFVLKNGLKKKFDFRPIELDKKNALIIGYGGVGRALASKALGFGMRVSVVDNKKVRINSSIEKIFLFDEIEVAIKNKDIIFIACPYTNLTHKLFDNEFIRKLKKDSILINISRGGIIDTNSLVKALEDNYFLGVGLDVTDPEPLPKKHKLNFFDRVVITPHIAGISDKFDTRNYKLIKNNIGRYINDKSLINVINIEDGY